MIGIRRGASRAAFAFIGVTALSLSAFPAGVAAAEKNEYKKMRELTESYCTGGGVEFDGSDPDAFSCTTTDGKGDVTSVLGCDRSGCTYCEGTTRCENTSLHRGPELRARQQIARQPGAPAGHAGGDETVRTHARQADRSAQPRGPGAAEVEEQGSEGLASITPSVRRAMAPGGPVPS